MIDKIRRIRQAELTSKLLFTMLMVVIMELGRQIAIPTLDSQTARDVLSTTPFLRNFSSMTGGQMSYPSLFSIGLGPYMTGMILFAVLQMFEIPALKNMSAFQIGMIQRFIAFFIAILQTVQMLYLIHNHIHLAGYQIFGVDYNIFSAFIILVTGAMIVSWMSDMTVERGVGGAGVLIIPGLISNIPNILKRGQGMGTGVMDYDFKEWIIIGIIVLAVFIWMIFMNKAELRITLQRPLVQNDFSSSYLPIRVLAAGSMPFMFSTSLFMIPSYITAFRPDTVFGNFVAEYLNFDTWIGIGIYSFIIVFLGYAFGYMNFRPEETAKGLKKSGDYIFGVTPGLETKRYLNQRLLHLSTIANIFFVLIASTPLIVGLYIDGIANLSFIFSTVLILVTIVDTAIEQVKTLHLRTQYNLLEL